MSANNANESLENQGVEELLKVYKMLALRVISSGKKCRDSLSKLSIRIILEISQKETGGAYDTAAGKQRTSTDI